MFKLYNNENSLWAFAVDHLGHIIVRGSQLGNIFRSYLYVEDGCRF